MPVYVVLELPTEEESASGASDGVFFKTRDAVEGLMRAKGAIVSEHDASIARTAAIIAVGFAPTAFHMEGRSWNVDKDVEPLTGRVRFIEIPDEVEEPEDV